MPVNPSNAIHEPKGHGRGHVCEVHTTEDKGHFVCSMVIHPIQVLAGEGNGQGILCANQDPLPLPALLPPLSAS